MMEGISTATTTGGIFNANDVTAETVMSDLNLFRTTSASLPQWEMTSTNQTGPSYTSMAVTLTTSVSTPSGHGHLGGSTSEHTNSEYGSNSLTGGQATVEDNLFPMTPPISDSGPCSSGSHYSGGDAHSDADSEQPARKKRTPIPSEKKDAKYWERRKKNNIAAKRSRELRKRKMDDEIKQARDAVTENQKLKQEIEVLKSEVNSLRRLLRDANMTLSLWIRAKQASEPTSQLPPMLRSPNVSFVNFPVSTSV